MSVPMPHVAGHTGYVFWKRKGCVKRQACEIIITLKVPVLRVRIFAPRHISWQIYAGKTSNRLLTRVWTFKPLATTEWFHFNCSIGWIISWWFYIDTFDPIRRHQWRQLIKLHLCHHCCYLYADKDVYLKYYHTSHENITTSNTISFLSPTICNDISTGLEILLSHIR